MNSEALQIFDFLKRGQKPTISDLKSKGFSAEAIEAIAAHDDVRSVSSLDIGNGSTVTRLVFIDPRSGQAAVSDF